MKRVDNNMTIYLVRFFNRHTLGTVNWKAFTKKEDAEKAMLFLLESEVIKNLAEAGIQNIVLEGIDNKDNIKKEIMNETNNAFPSDKKQDIKLTPISPWPINRVLSQWDPEVMVILNEPENKKA